MKTSIKALEVLEMEILENELKQRMGRGLTREESFYLSIATACSREGCELPTGLLEHRNRNS
jgi:hypothetical protein